MSQELIVILTPGGVSGLRDGLASAVSDGRDWTGLIFFMSAVLLSTFILLFLLSSSVSLSCFNLIS